MNRKLLKMKKMHPEKITISELEEIGKLQPEGWPDIRDAFRLYIESDFCHPFKMILNGNIVGLGNSVIFKTTVWLSHIIVDSAYRNRGIGSEIVTYLLKDVRQRAIESILLVATELGEPVYLKKGFRKVSDYVFFKREKSWIDNEISYKVKIYDNRFYSAVMELDKRISGENRESLIKNYLDDSFVYLENNEVKGFFLPSLGEGQIFAETSEAGIELSKLKYSKADRAVLPAENVTGINFLKENGFVITETKGKRMIFGKDIDWQPEKIYSRIGGNFG